MKIPGSIRNIYAEQRLLADLLKERVDALLATRIQDRWHYESRVKGEESFALKVETGRVKDLTALEDFFAATIVVPTNAEIANLEALINTLFAPHQRRPASDEFTSKAPPLFTFDDLRLYVRWIDDPTMPASGCAGMVFELQIKTFLQHAWSIATHDLIYKSDDANWSKMRIAFQIKAMLEHAEVSIQEASRIAESDALRKTDARTAAIKQFITMFTTLWDRDTLPSDIRRLAENAMVPAKMAALSVEELQNLLLAEREQGRGPLTQNLSPYGIVVQTVLNHRSAQIQDALSRDQRSALVVTRELEIPEGMTRTGWDRSTIQVG